MRGGDDIGENFYANDISKASLFGVHRICSYKTQLKLCNHDYTLITYTGVIQCSHAVTMSLHIEFDEFKGNIIISW